MVRSLPSLAYVLSLALPAAAQPVEEAVRFQYTAPPDCPDAASFTARVRQRTARGRLAEEGELARTFTLNVSVDPTGFLGGIEFLDEGGTPVSRRVRGEQCEAVVDSLALITALSLDATLREEEAAPTAPPKTSTPNAPPVTPVTAPPPVAAAPARVERGARLRGARLGVVGGYDTATQSLPLGLLGQLDWRSGLALRFTAHYGSDEFTVDEGRRASLRQLGLESSACPVRLSAGDFALAPCLDFDLGTLRVAGLKQGRLTSASGKTILWAAVGPELRLAWEPDVPFWVELRGALEFTLVRHSYEFEQPQKSVYEVPPLTAAAGVTTGVRFW